MVKIKSLVFLMRTVVFLYSLTTIESQYSVIGKPTFSSLPLYSATSVPALAVDGLGYNTALPADQSCFMTGNTTTDEETCWFAVDLELQLKLTYVKISLSYFSSIHSALNAYGNLVNVTVGITNSSPAVVTPRLGNYRQCGRYTSPITSSSLFISVGCWNGNPPSRYVVVQQAEGIGGYLTICEIGLTGTEVVAESITQTTTSRSTTTEMQSTPQNDQWPLFSRNNGNNASPGLENLPNYQKIRVRSDLECVLKCLEKYKDRCTSSNLIDGNENCQIAVSPSRSTGGNVVYGKDWLLTHLIIH